MTILCPTQLIQDVFLTPEFIEDSTLSPTQLIEGKFEEFISYQKKASENMDKNYELTEYIVTFKANFRKKHEKDN